MGEYRTAKSYPPVFLALQRQQPAVATSVSKAAFAGGFLVGWLLLAWVIGCHRQHPDGRGAAISFLGGITIVCAILTDLTVGLTALPLLLVGPYGGHGSRALLPANSPTAIFMVPALLTGAATIALARLTLSRNGPRP